MTQIDAAIYARFSSDNQREESIDAQIRAIKEFVAGFEVRKDRACNADGCGIVSG